MPSMDNDTYKYEKPSTVNYENEFILKEYANKEYFQKEILSKLEKIDISNIRRYKNNQRKKDGRK